MFQSRWPSDLGCALAAPAPTFERDMNPIYNRYAGNPAYVLLSIINHLFGEDESLVLKPMGHVCYLWMTDEEGEPDEVCYLIDVRFHDSGLLLELWVPSETIPLETVKWLDKEMTIPVFRKDEPLPEHPAAEWFMDVVRCLEEPPLLEAHTLLAKEISAEYIWSVCEELARAEEKIAELRGQPFPRPVDTLQAELQRLGKRFQKMTASTGITRLNLQAEIVWVVAQILLQTHEPEDDLRFPWMALLSCFGNADHVTPILAARAKAAFLVKHPELAQLPNDTGFSLRGPMYAVGLAIRTAIQRGVYQ